MKLWAIFGLAGAVGALAGGRYGSDFAAALLPDAGSHGAWYASRAAGIASYMFLWLGLIGGLLMSSAWFDGLIGRARLLAFHQTASIGGVVLGLGHALVLIPDGWTRFTLFDLFVPFGSYYEPLLAAIGTGVLYLSAVVSASFWFRSRLGTKMWRYLHYSSFLAFAGALWHGLLIGSDADEKWLLSLYLGTSMSVVFGVMIRITYRRPAVKRRVPVPAQGAEAA